ncbi:lipoprotein NlpI [Planctomycetes bacterium Pla163]|uniref:Lipoprotein NlpI n=1 Tax=Rohdeia mirabilis TaxID=2528008 RepID=A0A518CZM4_9BACT|nr:lipoprotein NlpI [Planctomycetes bacterium Pla163]
MGVAWSLALSLAACGDGAPAPASASASSSTAQSAPDLAFDGGFDGGSRALTAALDRVRAATERAPKDPAAWTERALVCEANGLDEAATAAWTRVTELAPNDARAWYHAARGRAAAGDLEGALAACDRTLALDADYAPAHWRRGTWLFELGRASAARDAFEAAARLDPTALEPVWGLARLALDAGDAERARALLEPVAERTRGRSYTFLLLASALRLLGDDARAATFADRAAEPVWIDPWKVEVLEHRVGYHEAVEGAQADIAKGDFAGAERRLVALLDEQGDDVSVTTMLASVHLAAREPERALDLLDEALERRPDHYRLHYNRALALGALERFDEQVEAAARTLELQPTFAPAWFERGKALVRLERFGAAAEALAKALEYGPRDARLERLLEQVRDRADASGDQPEDQP